MKILSALMLCAILALGVETAQIRGILTLLKLGSCGGPHKRQKSHTSIIKCAHLNRVFVYRPAGVKMAIFMGVSEVSHFWVFFGYFWSFLAFGKEKIKIAASKCFFDVLRQFVGD